MAAGQEARRQNRKLRRAASVASFALLCAVACRVRGGMRVCMYVYVCV